MNDRSDAIGALCLALSRGELDGAREILLSRYPFAPEPVTKRSYREREATQVFARDGFVDRYTGCRLVYPPVLRVISVVMPAEFPFHPAWKTDVTHSSYWEVGATVDHLIPVSRGGADNPSNLVTTSMARNYAKMNWTLEELGWTLHPPGDIRAWDGMMNWFVQYTAQHPHTANSTVRRWRNAAVEQCGAA